MSEALNLADGSPLTESDRARLAAANMGPSTASSTSRWAPDDWPTRGRAFDAQHVTLRDLEQMRRDPMIAFGLMFIKVFLARAPWYIKSQDAQIAGFVDAALRRIYGRFILQYCGSLDFGYQGLVKNFERTNVDWVYADPNDPEGKELPVWTSSAQPLIWKPFTPLNPRKCQPHFNRAGNFDGISLLSYASPFATPSTSRSQVPDIPLDWALWITNEKDSVFGSLWGYPRSAYAYRYWWAYWYRFGLADRAFERWADPPIIAYHPVDVVPGPDGRLRDFTNEGLALAEKLRSGANVSLPSEAVESIVEGRTLNLRKWELKQLDTTVNFDALNETFGYLDVAKLRSLMVPEQAFLEGQGGTSSRNVAATLGDVFEEQQAVIKAEIDDQINRYLIPQLVEANFGPNAPSAEIVTTGFDQADLDTARAVIQAFAQNDPSRLSSLDFRKLAQRLGLPVLNPSAAHKQAEEIAKAAAAAGPPKTPAKDGNAGVNSKGLYYDAEGQERIDLGDGEVLTEEDAGLIKKFLGLFRPKPEPQEIVLSVKTEVVDDDGTAAEEA